ncbi:L-lysine 6-transaminase [Nocardia spumae]|uniref:L-lysine 6-transaminase n=1 Tax=Nocardia spumae TaxID=2887190 RepID=UPI001D1352D7|nr:L-lysine 6-transaminase [Nocardia spumae]
MSTRSIYDVADSRPTNAIVPQSVHSRISKHQLADGFPIVLDVRNSHGSWLVDSVTGDEYLDLYTFFASSPLGFNPPGLADDPAFRDHLAEVAISKPANGDCYTTHLVEFIETFARVLGDPQLPHLFFVEGGALAVENALKCAFDWKSRHNQLQGRDPGLGTKVLHLTSAFHGRSGYTMSLTNTDPGKTERFPRFDWPRIDTPVVRFPLAAHLVAVESAERRALAQAEAAFRRHEHDIACFVAEPIQGEGGDNHMRAEFLQAMEQLCRDNDALFVLDEVQTGGGVTGTAWAYQQLGLQPDIVAFSKKVQLGGIMAGRRVDEVADNVFNVSGRISSTWGGGLVDMVRSTRLLDIIDSRGLIPRARQLGTHALDALDALAASYPNLVSNVRGRGLMCAFDLPGTAVRDDMIRQLLVQEKVIALPSGTNSVRIRPALSVTEDELALAVAAFGRVLNRISRSGHE